MSTARSGPGTFPGFEIKDISRTETRIYRPTPTGPLTVWPDQYAKNVTFYVDTVSVKTTNGVLTAVTVAGPRINKDGKPSASLRGRHSWNAFSMRDLPDWLRAMADDKPKGISRGR